MLFFYFGNSQGTLKLHRENTGKTQGILFSKMSGNHEITFKLFMTQLS